MRLPRMLSGSILLAMAGMTATAQAGAPSASDLAPLDIPNRPLRTEKFAAKLFEACRAVAMRPSPPPLKLDVAALADAAKADAVLDGWAATCDAITKLALTPGDLANLREFRKDPEGARMAILTAAKQKAKPAGAVPVAPGDLGALGADLVQGLANFIYQRAKAEALLYLQQRLKDTLCTAQRRPFFRNLCTVFDNANGVVSLASMGTFLTVAARKDLAAFPDTALAYGLYEGMQGTDKSPQSLLDAMTAARLGLAVYRSVQAGRTPLDALRSLHLAQPPKYASAAVLNAVDVASGLVDAIVEEDGWDDPAASDAAHLPFYAVAVLLRLDRMKLVKLDIFTKADAARSGLGKAVALVARLSTDLSNLKSQMTVLAEQTPKPTASGDAGNMIPPDAARNMTPPDAVHAVAAAAPTATSIQSFARQYASLASVSLQTVIADGGDFASALGLIDDGTRNQLLQVTALMQAAELALAAATPTDAIIASMEGVRKIFDDAGRPPPQVVQVVTGVVALVAQFAEAKSATDVSNVLEAAAAPISTYETKYRKSVVALNALVGVSGGGEVVSTRGGAPSGVVGAFAPVGLNATTPFGSNNWHVGAMLSFINLGALVSARFTSDTSSSNGSTNTVGTNPNVNFLNIVSPGAFVTLGIAGSPLIVGGGAQVLPGGRQVQMTSAGGTPSTQNAASAQFVAFLSADVPLFPF